MFLFAIITVQTIVATFYVTQVNDTVQSPWR